MAHPHHVLLIDDSPDSRLLVRRLLHAAFPDLTFTEVTSPAALTAALAMPFDVVITDYRLRWSDGISVLRTVKAQAPFCPVVMVANTGGEEVVVAAMHAGLDDYVAKRPGSIERLPAAITRAIEHAADRRRIAALEEERVHTLARLREALAEKEQALKEKEQALHDKDAAVALLDVLLQRAPIGLAYIDREYRYQRINETLATTNGLPVAAHLGRTLREVLPNLASIVEPIFAQVLESGAVLTNVEVAEPRDDGAIRIWEASYYPVRPSSGPPLGIGVIATDVTARRQAETLQRLFAQLSADIVDASGYHERLSRIAELTVPELADYCVLDVVEPDGEIVRAAVAHRDLAGAELLRRMMRYPPDLRREAGVPEVLRAGRPQVIMEVPTELLAAAAHDEHHLALLQALGPRSSVVLPLVARGSTIGALSLVMAGSGRQYSEVDLPLLQEFAARVALAIDHAHLYDLEHHTRQIAEQALGRLTQLHAMTAALMDALTPAQVAERILTVGLPALGAVTGWVVQVNPDGQHLSVIGASGFPPEVVATWRQIPLDADAPVAEAIRTATSIWVETLEERVRRYPAAAASDATSPGTWAAIPLIIEGHAIGGLGIGFPAFGPLPPGDQAFVDTLARQCAQALARTHLYESERSARSRLEETSTQLVRLQRITAALSAALRQEDVARVFVEQAIPAAGSVGGGVVVLSEGGGEALILGATGFDDGQLAPWRRFPLSRRTPAAEVLGTGAPVFITSLAEWERRFPDGAPAVVAQGYQAYAGFPLSYEGRTIGAMSFNFVSPRAFSSDEQEFMHALARQCAQALERARLYEAEQAARAEAQEAVQLRDAFFSVATHELRTPLTTLLGQAQLLQRRLRGGRGSEERDQRSLATIVAQAQRLNQQITELLDLARLAQGQFSVDRAPLDMCALARQIVETVQPNLERHTVLYEDEGVALIVLGDAARLEQVLQNLLQNAIKYSPEGGPVTVRVARNDDDVQVSVSDRGMGIPQPALPHLFERFYRADHRRAQGIGGLGVGLYVVKEIVTLHGGTVGVESSEGVGSTFTIRLPLHTTDTAARPTPQGETIT
jgi:PAS domain S-box-containing protein